MLTINLLKELTVSMTKRNGEYTKGQTVARLQEEVNKGLLSPYIATNLLKLSNADQQQ